MLQYCPVPGIGRPGAGTGGANQRDNPGFADLPANQPFECPGACIRRLDGGAPASRLSGGLEAGSNVSLWAFASVRYWPLVAPGERQLPTHSCPSQREATGQKYTNAVLKRADLSLPTRYGLAILSSQLREVSLRLLPTKLLRECRFP